MARQREEVDWYVDLSERMERRESRRKWVILGFCVAVALLVMGGFLLYIVVDKSGWLMRLRLGRPAGSSGSEKPVRPKEDSLGPVAAKAFQKGDIRFPQLDSEDMPLGMSHYFREERPEKEDSFTVNRESEERGTIRVYRLKNVGYPDVYEFSDVPVKKIGGEWTITEEGWNKVRNELRAKMKVKLGPPQL